MPKRFLTFGLISCVCLAWGLALTAEDTDPATSLEEPAVDESDRDYWAYQPVQKPEVPDLSAEDWTRNPIDKFVLLRLREKDLHPVESADQVTLIRRLSYNLTGLPPSPQQIEEFLHDIDDGAYERLVDRLLDSPAYGERWGQHWLDLVRFAETDGFEHDKVRPQAWRYRDWIINAFNTDLPYDKFLQYQLAGDEIAPDSPQALIATGYLLAGPDMPDINLQEERRHNFLNAMTANVGEVILGLRFGCCQCHHHRTDPISQHDFYRLRAFFDTMDLFKDHRLPAEAGEKEIKARIAQDQLQTRLVSHLWIRGDFRRPGPVLQPQFPRVLAEDSAQPDDSMLEIGPRRVLAEWLTQREHPLTARVMVNRIWQSHFGVGLIGTPSDFGWLGEGATHPELLDWLAAEFMDSGWSMKQLHRLILTSSTYRLASYPSDGLTADEKQNWNKLLEEDPSNNLLGRMFRQRLEAEVIRDALLTVSGELNPKAGGPGVRPPLPPAVASTLLKNQWPVTEDESEHTRRSIYLFARRNLGMPMLQVFDKPDSNLSCPRRSQTTIAPQALHLLNSGFTRERAEAFAKRVLNAANDRNERIETTYVLALGRRPTDDERQSCREFLAEESNAETGWMDLCHALFNLNEFVYVD